jgi:hypothetical protein
MTVKNQHARIVSLGISTAGQITHQGKREKKLHTKRVSHLILSILEANHTHFLSGRRLQARLVTNVRFRFRHSPHKDWVRDLNQCIVHTVSATRTP